MPVQVLNLLRYSFAFIEADIALIVLFLGPGLILSSKTRLSPSDRILFSLPLTLSVAWPLVEVGHILSVSVPVWTASLFLLAALLGLLLPRGNPGFAPAPRLPRSVLLLSGIIILVLFFLGGVNGYDGLCNAGEIRRIADPGRLLDLHYSYRIDYLDPIEMRHPWIDLLAAASSLTGGDGLVIHSAMAPIVALLGLLGLRRFASALDPSGRLVTPSVIGYLLYHAVSLSGWTLRTADMAGVAGILLFPPLIGAIYILGLEKRKAAFLLAATVMGVSGIHPGVVLEVLLFLSLLALSERRRKGAGFYLLVATAAAMPPLLLRYIRISGSPIETAMIASPRIGLPLGSILHPLSLISPSPMNEPGRHFNFIALISVIIGVLLLLRRRNEGERRLAWIFGGISLVVFNPLLVPLLSKAIGRLTVDRIPALLPIPCLIGAAIALPRLRRDRIIIGILLTALAVFSASRLAPPLPAFEMTHPGFDTVRFPTGDDPVSFGEPEALIGAARYARQELPEGSVLLARFEEIPIVIGLTRSFILFTKDHPPIADPDQAEREALQTALLDGSSDSAMVQRARSYYHLTGAMFRSNDPAVRNLLGAGMVVDYDDGRGILLTFGRRD